MGGKSEYQPKESRNVTGIRRPGRDDTLDPELERERREPGMDSEGTGGAGANPDSHHEDSNSNT